MVQTWRTDVGNNRDTNIISEIINSRHHSKHGDNIRTYLFIYLLNIYKQVFITLQDFQSVLRHLAYISG